METTPTGGVQSWLSDWLDEPVLWRGMIVTRRIATQLAFEMDEGEEVIVHAGELPRLDDVHPDDLYTYVEATYELANMSQALLNLPDRSREHLEFEFAGTPMGDALGLGLSHSDI